MTPNISLKKVTLDDVARIGLWLEDSEISNYWFGQDESGTPLHIGYSPRKMLGVSDAEWAETFSDENRLIASVYDSAESHIGETQIVFEHALHEAQVFLIIGRKDLWLHHFGTAALIKLLDYLFQERSLHRVWVDVPVYNIHAAHICERLGFI